MHGLAAAVFKGQRPLSDCPQLDPETARRYTAPQVAPAMQADLDLAARVQDLVRQISETDLAAAAKRVGGEFDGTALTLMVMGKPFRIDTHGKISTDIHVNPLFMSILG